MEGEKSTSAFEFEDATFVREFDRIMQKTKDKLSEDKGSKSSSNRGDAEEREDPWLVGDYCRAVYEVDGQLYEAKIVAINENSCTIEFLGYGEKVDMPISSLHESSGKEAREAQRSYAGQAGASNYANATEYSNVDSDNTVPKLANINPVLIGQSLDLHHYPGASAAKNFPKNRYWPRNNWDKKRKPWLLGDYCRAFYPEDGWWYEAEILAIHDDSCTIQFIGYEDTAVVSLENLSESRGNWIRTKQIRMSQKYENDSDRSNAIEERKKADRARDNAIRKKQIEIKAREDAVKIQENTVPRDANHGSKMQQNYHYDRRPRHREQLFDSNAPAVSHVSNVRMSGLPPPPIPCMPQEPAELNDPALSSMLMAWYMAGYYTGLHKNLNRHGGCCYHH